MIYSPQKPSKHLVTQYVRQAVKDRFVTGFRWTDENSKENSYELGKFLDALAVSTADIVYEIQKFKVSTPFYWAHGDVLTKLAAGYGLIRQTDETDIDLVKRIETFLVADRNTTPGIRKALSRYYPHITFFEPWTKLDHASCGLTLSGDVSLPSRLYWNAGVFDVHLYVTHGDLHAQTTVILDQYKPAGSLYWLSLHHPTQAIDWNNDELIAENEYDTIAGHDGTELWDPRTSKKEQRVVVSNRTEAVNLAPELDDTLYAPKTEILHLSARAPMYTLTCGSLIPIAMLDTDDPDYVGSPVPDDIDPEDLEPNMIMGVDYEESLTQGMSIPDIQYSLFLCNTQYTDLQAGVVVTEID